MFAGGAVWEDIDADDVEDKAPETEDVEPEDGSVLAQLDATGSDGDLEDADGDDDGADVATTDAAPETAARAAEDDQEVETPPAAPPSEALALGADPQRSNTAERDGDDADDDDDDDAAFAPRATAAQASTAPPPTAVAPAPAPQLPPHGRASDRHARPYERRVRKASGHDPKQDRYNRRGVRSRRAGNRHQIGRPGVRVAGKDEFHLKNDFAYRFMITNGNHAEVVDKIWERDLEHGREEGQRLAINPAHSRKLMINGVQVECVMSWSGGQSAAWIAVRDLRGNTGAIKRAVNGLARRWAPKAANKRARDRATRMTFRAADDPLVDADRLDDRRYVVPGQRSEGGNKVGDYYTKRVPRREQQGRAGTGGPASEQIERRNGGNAIDLPNVKRETINIAMNLPKDKTPPVAVDVARPGDAFFVPKGQTFRREISMYRRRSQKSKLRQKWVYGFVGKDEGNRKVADEKRRGWVPLRVLARP